MKELSLNVAHAAFRGSSRSGRMAHVKMNENMMTMMMIRLRAVWTIALVPFVVNALDATSLSEVPAVALGSGVTSPSEPLEGPTDWESKLSAGLVYKSGNTDSERMTLGLATEKFAGQTLPINEAADLLWHAHLAGHSSGYLDQLQQLIQACTREDVQRAAQRLNDAAGGWQCVANGPRISDDWQAAP